MVAINKEWVLIIDIPKKIYEYQKRGYTHFEADFTDDTRRVELRFWRRPEERPRRTLELICSGTRKEECEHPPFNNSAALDLHQRARKHGRYAE
ncbi:MAG: hypothetical protein JRM85_07995 [Nitrososphaerota archaeon]|nr:hypothetical protein [Nitrososphaerota archaeon]